MLKIAIHYLDLRYRYQIEILIENIDIYIYTYYNLYLIFMHNVLKLNINYIKLIITNLLTILPSE